MNISYVRNFAGATLVAIISISQPSMAGIPVTVVADVPGQIAQIQNYAQMLKDYVALKDQLDTARKNLESISGSRGLANVINTMYDMAVTVDPNKVLQDAGIKDASEHGLTGDAAELYNSGNRDTATWLGQSAKSLEQAQKRFTDLTGLVAKVNASPDQKDILDLQARIGAEQVMLQNEMAKLAMLRSESEANRAMQNQRIQQMRIESSGKPFDLKW